MPLSKSETKNLLSWASYDWANSAYSAIIETFVFATYFATSVAINSEIGASSWGLALGISGLFVALTGPILGSLADKGGHRKSWLAFFTTICIIAIAFMWFVKPSPDYTFLALSLIAVAAAASESATIFYNAMLPDLAPSNRIGRWSGWGWAFGYAGGMVSLILALLFFIQGDSDSLQIRNTFLFCAFWYALFALPIFLFIPEKKGDSQFKLKSLISDAFAELLKTFRQIRSYKNIVRFLIGRMLYTDALITLFAFGGIYAATTYEMNAQKVLLFGIGLNITAGIGAILFAPLDDKFSAKSVIIGSLIGLLITGSATLLVSNETLFWIFGLSVGFFVGPAQASGRSYLARVAPPALRNQMFGFFALSAKATAFLGPLLVGALTLVSGSLRWGMAAILFLIGVGLWIISGIRKEL